ncbi:unnamed protein product [Linum trigynum]|uniref:Uncharacterized protein n=1 Tax=Linum trigynum TaxID=586398 RepID=A0AAV2GUA1_9ROSI
MLWQIWKSHNWVVFEGVQYQIDILIRQFEVQVRERVAGTDPRRLNGEVQDDRLSIINNNVAQGMNWVCYFDGAMGHGSHSAISIVLRGMDGVVVSAKRSFIK